MEEMSEMTEYKNTSLKKIEELTDRELQEWIYRILVKQERHQKYFSSVLTVFLVLAFTGVCILIYSSLAVKMQ